jgi:predicted  nucleic acid-binding Zn-ribbon protein
MAGTCRKLLGTVHELIENLVKLQAIELERTRLSQAARALPAEAAQVETALQAAERQAAAASDALSREDTLRTRLEREAAGHRQKASRYRAQLDTVTTPAQAEAMEFAEVENERLDAEEYTSLERTEAQETALAAARAQVEALATVLDKTRARIALRRAELSHELLGRNAEREAVRLLIEPEWLARFDHLVVSRGTAVARVDNMQCTGCRMGIRAQTWNQLREGELLTCDSCGRLLYWDPAIAPAPKAPQPDAAAAASGRAIRK